MCNLNQKRGIFFKDTVSAPCHHLEAYQWFLLTIWENNAIRPTFIQNIQSKLNQICITNIPDSITNFHFPKIRRECTISLYHIGNYWHECWHHILSNLLLSAPLSRHGLRAANTMGCLRVRHACILNKTDNKSCHVHLGLSNCLHGVVAARLLRRGESCAGCASMAVVLTLSASSCQQKT